MAYSFNPFTGNFDYYTTGGGSGTPGGSDTEVQFNDGGAFGGDPHFTYDKTNDALHVHKIAGDATDGLLIESANGTDVGILGAANTANVTWYGNHNFDPATANTIASFGASKTLSSLSTATYPSLTELSYVKGVTSAIQTQLDNKQPLDSDLTTIAGLTATTDNFMQAKAGAWASRTVAQVKTDLGLTGTNSGDVTLAGTPDYITISGQVITRNKLDPADDLNTFSSSVLAGLLTDETGTGSAVFATSPNLTGTPSIQPTAPINNPPYSIVSDRPTTNLIINPSFEVNVTDGWFQKGTATITRDTTDKFIGDASMKIVTSAVDSGVTSSLMTIDSSSRYVLSFWVKGAVGGESLEAIISASLGTATMTIASPCVVTRNSHGLTANTSIYFTTTGALPTGVTAYTAYYVISTGLTANTFQFSTTLGGAAVNTSGTQSGTHSLFTNDRSTKDVFLYGMRTVPSTTWRRMRWFFTSGASTTSATVSLNSITAGSQTLYIDGVQFEKQTLPTGSTDSPFASAYCDGSLGNGHSWSGTAHNSTSSRVAGIHSLAPLSSTSAGGLIQRPDGSISGKFSFEAQEAVFGTPALVTSDEPYFPFQVKGNFETNTLTSGSSQGVALFENKGNGAALFVQSSATTSAGVIYDFDSLTTGSGVAVYAPANLSTLYTNLGTLLKFAGKTANQSLFSVSVPAATFGDTALLYEKRLTVWSGGGMTATDTASRTGTVSVTTANATCTGVGTTFLADYRPGDNIQIEQTAGTWTSYTVASLTSDTVLTMTSNGTAIVGTKAHRSKTRQYAPAVIQLEGIYGNHNAGSTDFLYNIYASGGNGQLRVLKSASRGSTTVPSADNVGYSLLAGRLSTHTVVPFTSASETTVVTGYTTPAYELQAGNTLKIKFFGSFDALASTSTITWRVKLGGTTILTSTARQVGSANLMHFEGEITIVGTSTTAQKASIHVTGQDTTTVTAGGIYDLINSGTGAVDCRIDRAVTVTAQFSDASTMNFEYSSIYLEQ